VKHILTTTFDFVRENRDIGVGGIRLINLRLLPTTPPMLRIADFIAPAPPHYRTTSLYGPGSRSEMPWLLVPL
jgi:hypothetical protein